MSTNTPPDGLKSIGQPEHLPPLWWLNPWRAAIQQAKASDIYRAWWLSTDKQLCATAAQLAGRKLQADATEKVILDTANEAGFQESKTGYVIPSQPHSPFPLKWLGEAVAYWKSEAYAARRERDDAKADKAEADKHHTEEQAANVQLHNELAEERHNNVFLKQELAEACEQANKAGDDIEKLAAKALELEQKVMDLEAKWPRDLWNGGKIYGDVYTCQPKPYYPDAHKDLIEKYAKADAKRKRKPAKKKGGRK